MYHRLSLGNVIAVYSVFEMGRCIGRGRTRDMGEYYLEREAGTVTRCAYILHEARRGREAGVRTRGRAKGTTSESTF